ncbi:NAC transcription factor 29-like protein [Cinnamomum micranthum f. kanehirae]|uniref:NAC transcription factor 29-like protein n=1 Tax=Cinnamomum micranthum f. kanehirae TaxID=337451 RepID=A0A3S3NNK4_9MAGN|nr:NAC transcription factor 29-like protein [Cinnamomum micranthum f. kanehirae]
MSCGATTSTSMRVPCGYRFRPTEKELLKYLKRKIDNLPLPCDLIKEVELYKFDPTHFGSRGEEKCYFFTSTYRKYRNGNRPSRSTKSGHWKASTGETEIKEGNKVIGTTRSLVFYYGEHPLEKKTNWIMHEYRLSEHHSVNHAQFPTDPMKLDKWVICSIYENLSASERENRKRKAIVLSEGLDTTCKKREIVLQQGPLNGYQENDLSMVPLFDNLPEERIPYDQSIVLYEGLNTKGKKREIILQQIPLNGNQENDQSIVPLNDHLLEEHIPIASDMGCNIAPLSDIDLARELIPNASNTGCDIAPLSDTDLAKELIANASNTSCDINPLGDTDFAKLIEMLDREPANSFDNLPEELIPNASVMGCGIAPPSDTGIADFAELMEILDRESTNYYDPSSSSSS